jgi:lipopolysaccharide biosynthesis regulator YciM
VHIAGTGFLSERLEFRCEACGYGIVVTTAAPTLCPMCNRVSEWTPITAELTRARRLPQRAGRL